MKNIKKLSLILIIGLVLILTACSYKKYNALLDQIVLTHVIESDMYDLLENKNTYLTSNILLKDKVFVDDSEIKLEWTITSGEDSIDLNGVITRQYGKNAYVEFNVKYSYNDSYSFVIITFVIEGYSNRDLILGDFVFTNPNDSVDYLTNDFELPSTLKTPNGEVLNMDWYEYLNGKYTTIFNEVKADRFSKSYGAYLEKYYLPEITIDGKKVIAEELKVTVKIVSLNVDTLRLTIKE